MFASRDHDETIVTAYQCWRPGVASYRGWYLVRLDGERVSVADIDLAADGVPDGNLAACYKRKEATEICTKALLSLLMV